jgi:hypothetical protein
MAMEYLAKLARDIEGFVLQLEAIEVEMEPAVDVKGKAKKSTPSAKVAKPQGRLPANTATTEDPKAYLTRIAMDVAVFLRQLEDEEADGGYAGTRSKAEGHLPSSNLRGPKEPATTPARNPTCRVGTREEQSCSLTHRPRWK